MTTVSQHCTIQISSVVLQVRADLSIAVREFGGQAVYVIEDEINSRFFRIGLSEYTFLSALDGHTTFADALGRTASAMKEEALTESEAAAFCRWLIENRLASTPHSATSARLLEAKEQVRQRMRRSLLNPMFVRIPLLNPDSLLRTANTVFGWLFSWPLFLVWWLVVSAGILNVWMNWSAATSASAHIISPSNWIWLLGTWLLLKLVHETAHGITCRRFGGAVREAGVLLLLFIPLPYVDVTSTWRFDSKWHRIAVSAAGMYAEVFLAGAAAIVWAHTAPGILHQHAFNVMLSGSLVTVVFNANPLMRFDGYFILTDLLEMPNLAPHGQQALKKIGRRVFFGLPTNTANWPERRAGLILMYGCCAFAWRILVCIGLVLAADALYFGAGLVLVLIAVILWVGVPLVKLARFALFGSSTERPRRGWFVGVAGSLAAIGFVVWTYVPYYTRYEVPAIVDYTTLVEVRAGVSGFIDSVEVECGQRVAAGDLLATLRNPELTAKRNELLVHLKEAQQRARLLFERELIAAWQVERKNEAALQKQLLELDEQFRQLQIRAPLAGIIVDGDLQEKRGTYSKRGERLLGIGDDSRKQIIALIGLPLADAFSGVVGSDVNVHIRGAGTERIAGRLMAPSPRATTEIIHPAFPAALGGPLPTLENQASETQSMRFAEPQFRTVVDVDAALLCTMRTGRPAIVSFRTSPGMVGDLVQQTTSRWIQEHRKSLAAAWSY